MRTKEENTQSLKTPSASWFLDLDKSQMYMDNERTRGIALNIAENDCFVKRWRCECTCESAASPQPD